jgi:hypothetical protein
MRVSQCERCLLSHLLDLKFYYEVGRNTMLLKVSNFTITQIGGYITTGVGIISLTNRAIINPETLIN